MTGMLRVDFSAWLWPGDFTDGAPLHAKAGANDGAAPAPVEPKFYHGYRDDKFRLVVTVSGKHPLDPRLDLFRHSPDGFEIGFHGKGPAQLALAMLADALGDDGRALSLHRHFCAHYTALVQRQGFEISAARVVAMAEDIEAKMARLA